MRTTKNISQHLEAVFDAVLDAVIVSDAHGIIQLFNPAAEQMFGYVGKEIIGLSINVLMTQPDSVLYHLYIEKYLKTHQKITKKYHEVTAKHCDGETFLAEITISNVVLEGEIFIIALVRDITGRKNKEQKIMQLAFFDQETELPNNYYLQDKLEELLNDTSNEHFLVSLYLENLSDYINIFGTQGIKEVIIALTNLLHEQFPEQCLIARCGSRRLKLVYSTTDKNLTIEQLAEQIKACCKQALTIRNNQIFLNVTFGLTKVIPEQHSVETLLDQADIAQHIAKHRVSDSYQIFEPQLSLNLHRRASIVQKLYKAVRNVPFELYLQPQIDLTTARIIGAEALIRWKDTDGQWIPPNEFIPIAETTGLISDITLWTLIEACKIVTNWKVHSQQHYRIAINISAHIICTPDFVEQLGALINETGVSSQDVELEITETALMLNPDIAINTVSQLADLGFSIAIDDFGTGLSSLAYLKQFKVDRLKIDRSFLINAVTDTHDQAMLAAIINLGHQLDYQVVCEGVEYKSQATLLKKLGCDEVQGYYFARPMPYTEFLSFAENFWFE